MKDVCEGIYQWSVFNEEKGLNFNGLYLETAEGTILVDPPPLSEEDIAEIEKRGIPHEIYLTNKHHTRASAEHRERWGSKIFVSEDDQALMEIPVDGTFSHGKQIAGEIEVIHIPNAKTPGECAFHWPQKNVLILGDAIISKPDGLAMLPDEKFKDPALARQGLTVLKELHYETLLLGDGEALLSGASQPVNQFIDSAF